jgi:carboxylate-amine ligase
MGSSVTSGARALRAFAGCGVELEYMLADRKTLSVLPVADEFLRRLGADDPRTAPQGFAWSEELVPHVLELKNVSPIADLDPLPRSFQAQVRRANRLLATMGARLMPTAMHPWMEPRSEMRLWPRDHSAIYAAYDSVFDCRQHGFANIQSMQVNLPFANDAEFARLHEAIRLVLPILPALAASSPIVEGDATGLLDSRMEAYRTHTLKIPSITGRVIPDPAESRAEYEADVLATMYRDIAPQDPDGVLQHEWLNCRGAIPRFDRNAIEIRVIDMQECPQADIAIAIAAVGAIRAIYDHPAGSAPRRQRTGTDALAEIMMACMQDAERATIDDAGYLSVLGFPGRKCEAGELWRHLVEVGSRYRTPSSELALDPLRVVLEQGPLARRILRAVGQDRSRARLSAVYRELCDCLDEGRMFVGLS